MDTYTISTENSATFTVRGSDVPNALSNFRNSYAVVTGAYSVYDVVSVVRNDR